MRTPVASPASVSSVVVTEPSSEFSIGTTAWSTSRSCTAITVSQTVPYGTSSTPAGADARRASSANVPDGPRKPTRTPDSGAHGRERGVDRLPLLGRELDLGLALVQLLDVEAGLVAVNDRRDHDARLVRVEQRQRARLVARQLVVGVVAHERAVGHAAVESALGRLHPALEMLDRLLDPVAHVGEALL